MRFVLFTFIILSGCAVPAPYAHWAECYQFESDKPLGDTKRFDDNATLVRRLMLERLGFDFCSLRGGVEVMLIDDPFLGIDGHQYDGETQPFLPIMHLLRDLGPLAHESLHHWDFAHGAMGSAWHENWDKNGYLLLADEYKRWMTRPLPDS